MAQYADIIEILAPAESAPGSQVNVLVKVKNLYATTISLMIGGSLEYGISPWPSILFEEPVADVEGLAAYTFGGFFVMPDKPVTLHLYSYWYGADGYWHLDDEMTRVISPAALTPQVSEFKITDFSKV